MKRPEGYATPAGGSTSSGTTRTQPPSAPKRGAAKPAPQSAPPAAPSRPAAAAAASARPANRVHEAEAELRAVRRERKRHEKAELRRFTRRSRRRRLAWLAAIGIVVVLAVLLVVAVYSPLLALRTIRIDGTSRIDAAALEKAVDGQLGTPLALLDNDRLTRELGAFQLIRSYTTELLPPGTLVIHVSERTPIGVVKSGASFDLVDPAGIVVETSPTRPDGTALIQLDGEKVGSSAFLAMTEVLRALPPEVLAKVDSVSATTHDDVTLALTGSSQRVVWGSAEHSARKALVLTTLLGLHGGAGAGEYDVSAPGSAVFRPE